MRLGLLVAALALLVAVIPVTAQDSSAPDYHVKIDKVYTPPQHEGKKELRVTVQFRILLGKDGPPATDLGNTEIVVEEDNKEVARWRIPARAELTVILAMDISGSMKENGKIVEAKRAAQMFFKKFDDKANCGLVLFDHLIRKSEATATDPARYQRHRQALSDIIAEAEPLGGTAYLDATVAALDLLKGIRGRKAVLVMTDGVDLNSKLTLEAVINQAQNAEVPVYTLGVGEPGQNEKVTTVLVFDRSGSMKDPAAKNDRKTKMQAAKEAAGRFVDLMRPGGRTTLLPFSDKPEKAGPFRDHKAALKDSINALEPGGHTAFIDATYDALETLLAEQPLGKRAVVVMTDGKDNKSIRRIEDVIENARAYKIPLYLIGLGQEGDIDEKAMQRMADETGGKYYPARNQQQLFELFENLSIQLHDDGVDEASLKRLAEQTGGKYYPARKVSDLEFIYGQFANELQDSHTVTFPSRRPKHDGTKRDIQIKVLRDGVVVSDVGESRYQVHGVVVPEMHPSVYLLLLALLGGLLALPPGLRQIYRLYGGK